MLRDTGDDIDLDFNFTPELGLDGCSRWSDSLEKLCVLSIELAELLNIRKVTSAFNDIITCAASLDEDFVDMLERNSRLLFDGSFDHRARLKIERTLSANVKPAIDNHTSRISSGVCFFLPDVGLRFCLICSSFTS